MFARQSKNTLIEMKKFKLGPVEIGENRPCLVIAEIGINFNGSKELALKMIDAAGEAGCGAVKFQLFKASRMYTEGAGVYTTSTGEKIDIIDVVRDAELPYQWIPDLIKRARKWKMAFFSSVFDERSADALEKYGTDAYKIASYELTHIPLIKHLAKKNKPLIISNGGGRLSETAEAVETALAAGKKQIILNHCIAKYDARIDELNLESIRMLKLAFPETVIGYSDHSSDPTQAPKTAVYLGVKAIEKHITLDKKMSGPDHSFALDPKGLKLMVKVIRDTEKKVKNGRKIVMAEGILGSSARETFSSEAYVRNFAYRSLFAIDKIKKGEKFGKKNLAVLRSGDKKPGLHPRYFDLLISGHKATREIELGSAICWDDVLS